MGKRGQITIFIIIAIVILAIIALFFILRKENIQESVPNEIMPIYNFVKNCVEETAYNGVYEIGERGGYYFLPRYATEDLEPYYVSDNLSYAPEKEVLEEQLSFYINENLKECIKSFDNFSGFEIKQENVLSKIKINNESILINVEYPLNIKKGETSFKIENFNTKITTRLGLIHYIALEISKLYLENKGFSLTYFSRVEDETGIRFNLEHYPNYTVINIIDDKGVDNLPYIFKFAVK